MWMLLAGCAPVGPAYVPPQLPLPSSWSNAAAPPVKADDLGRWWVRLGDPMLSDLVARAMQANADLRSARARLREARARRALASAQRAPAVGASASAAFSRSSESDVTQETYKAGFDAGWEIDVFGGQRRALEGAEADLQASDASVDATRVTLAAEVARNYVELRAFQKRLEIARSNLMGQSETLQLTEWRAQAGLVSSLDVEQARANREQTRAQIPSLQTSVAEAQHRLAILLGVAPGTLNGQLAAAAPIPQPPEAIAAGIPADVLRQRPDVRAAERTLAAETARIGLAEAARYPSFNLTGSIGVDAFGIGVGSTVTRSLAASVAATIFDGGRLKQQVETQRAVQERAQVSYESIVLTALEDVENALVGLSNARARRAALTEATDAARNAALYARHRYRGGLIDFQTVLDTERSVLSLEDGLATSEADGVLAVIQLYKALGGGWESQTSGSSQ
jgi:NodT family efflux transporter outer membrane factor (OMF) lipoprotein